MKEPQIPGGGSRLCDHIIHTMALKNDAALARFLELAPPVVSKWRHDTMPVGDTAVITIHERTDIPVREIKAFLYAGKVAA